jgi:mannosyltransferase OCH1-like enzyme
MSKIPLNTCALSAKQIKNIRNKLWDKHRTRKIRSKSKREINKYISHLFENQKYKDKKPVIPLTICQVWHDKSDIPKSVEESIHLIQEQNPEFKHYLFEEKDWEKFIKENYSKRILHAYHSVVPYAIKADLFRYCYLYKNGGIYLDSKYYCINGFKLILLTDKEYFCKDIETSLHGIYNAFIVCKPKNKILFKAINECVKNIENKYYGNSGLCPTGPLLLKKFFTRKQINNLELRHEYINNTNRFILLNGYRILKYHEDYRKEKEQQNNHWSIYWKNKTMYK